MSLFSLNGANLQVSPSTYDLREGSCQYLQVDLPAPSNYELPHSCNSTITATPSSRRVPSLIMMLHSASSFATIFSLLPVALAAPTPLSPRAGGPIAAPITDCNIASVYPSFPKWGFGFVPSSAFVSTNLLYSYLLDEEYQLIPSEETLLTNCLETCHGFGNPGQCQSVFFAYNFPDRPEGRELGTILPVVEQAGCVLFSRGLTPPDLVQPVFNGTYTTSKAANLTCPASSSR
jgi:hypothetical protein